MIIKFHKNFSKTYQKLNTKLQLKVDETIEIFQDHPSASKLKNHALKGRLSGKRAISVTGDIRIIFEEYDNYTVVLMLDLGTHNQVY